MLDTVLASPNSEVRRLAALAEYGLLDTAPEDPLDRLTQLAAGLFRVPIVLLSLVDADRQFFKSRVGLPVCELDRDTSFCTHAIRQNDIFVVPDAATDPRFATNPLVLGPPFIRFYAGKTLVAPDGEHIGTLCLIDTAPDHPFTEADAGNLRHIASLVIGQMDLRRLDRARTDGRARFQNIAATSPDAIICADAGAGVTFWNAAAERLFGYGAHAFGARELGSLVAARHRASLIAELDRLGDPHAVALGGRTIELSCLRHDGTEFPAEFSCSTWQEGGRRHVGVIVRDVTEQRRTEERLFRLASRDVLTDLPNRAGWRDAVARAFAANRAFSVMLLDLDGFKRVNDMLGHMAGDLLLREVAGRLQAACSATATVARLGGDEFGVLLPGDDRVAAEQLAGRLIRTISEPFTLAGEAAAVGLSIGIAMAPAHGGQSDELCSAADLALYRAKGLGKGCFEVFAPALRQVESSRRAFADELRRAFADGAFELFYQPQIALPEATLAGAEALLRWNHPARGPLAPAHFIEVLGRDVSAIGVGAWVLRTACDTAAAWQAAAPGLRMGVNLFAAQLRSDAVLAVVGEALADSGLPPALLELELPAALFAQEDAVLIRRLHALRALGVGLVLDNVGTAPMPLSALKRLPLSRLKIDRTLIRGIGHDPTHAAIVDSLFHLGRRLGIAVSAKGVETPAQRDALLESCCRDAQGLLWGGARSRCAFAGTFLPQLRGE